MRLRLLLLLPILAVCLSTWATVASAWEQLDYDIFDLVDDVRRAHGDDATFYSVLGVPETATVADINKAHRKLSRSVHPDKNPTAEAEKVFKRLGAVTSMLKDAERRERYNFFMKNGVPVWRGTGYYYKRHRPGLGGVLAMLVLFGSAVHYLLMRVAWWRGNERWKTLQADMKKRKGRTPPVVQGYVVTEKGDWPVERPGLTSVFAIAMPVWLVRRLLGIGHVRRQADHDDEDEAALHAQQQGDDGSSGTARTTTTDHLDTSTRMVTRSRRRKAKQ